MSNRYIPAEIRRNLRQEARFGCVLCGSPIIEYHHIVPFHEIKKHIEEKMVVVCPEHHHRADCGEVPREVLYRAKKSPYNLKNEVISKDFFLRDYDHLKIKAGSNTFIRTPELIVVDGEPLLEIHKDEGIAKIDAKFYNRHNKLLAEIINNEWFAYRSSEFWDVQYSPGHLKINRSAGNILMDFKFHDDIVNLTARMYFNGHIIDLQPNQTVLGNNTISNSVIADCEAGIVLNYGHKK
ncbi:HNH endonuclease signature motif containing protein [Sporolactobacillus sp. Y61]|uniref:HNH endonuclease signature motif containing protein n=1 Tax=Sporolactobacillus sp. Y61 TaxID=3160863 RepID=A0AAU8IIW4_9BACL